MDIFDYLKREAQIKKHCFTKLLDFTDYYRFWVSGFSRLV